MQIDANFINYYFDYLKGSDREDRLGPERACAQGWITLNAMRKGIALTTATACLAGFHGRSSFSVHYRVHAGELPDDSGRRGPSDKPPSEGFCIPGF